jgi:hypothetical protein
MLDYVLFCGALLSSPAERSGCDKSYSTMELCSKAAARVKGNTTFCFARDTPLRLPFAVRSKKDLWRAVMTTQYGDYDRDRRCWRTKYELERDTACMRPVRLDARVIEHEWGFYLVAGSRDLDIAAHVSPGLIGLPLKRT